MFLSLIAFGLAVAARLAYSSNDPLPGAASGGLSQVEEFFIRAS